VPSSKVDAGLHNAAWIRTPDGAMAVGEPEIAWWWFPSNDHPSDKATFDVSVTVPDDLAVISNGDMAGFPLPETLGYSRWSWRSLKPQATYLAFVAIGKYDLSLDTTAGGQPIWNAYSQLLPQSTRDAAEASIERTAEITDWESTLFGPWPFEARGGVAAPPDALGFALENQTRPTYSDAFWLAGANTSVIVHENAHQWFGDSVSLSRWQDIWLNEGFASYAEWLWSEKNNEGTAQDLFNYLYATNAAGTPFWTVAPAAPGVANLFSPAVYERGAMALHQLRRAVGDTDFFRILRTWTADHRYGNATTEQFTALAEKISGKDLEALLKAWLYTPSKPVLPKLAKAAPTAPKSWAQISRTHALLHEH
jgi:aminopeptidase N